MTIDGQLGFTKESFDKLADFSKTKEVQCNLVFDEMSIRKQVEMDSNRNLYDFVDLGVRSTENIDKIMLEAKNALFLY